MMHGLRLGVLVGGGNLVAGGIKEEKMKNLEQDNLSCAQCWPSELSSLAFLARKS